MTRAELEALALRVEREEPGAKLDGDIYTALTGYAPIEYLHRYTTSLDAAASLVGDRPWSVNVNHHRAEAVIGHSSRFAEVGRGIAKTPAAALTAAALRARGMEASDD